MTQENSMKRLKSKERKKAINIFLFSLGKRKKTS